MNASCRAASFASGPKNADGNACPGIRLLGAGLFDAAGCRSITPHQTEPEHEKIEIMTGGAILFGAPEAPDTVYRSGAIFWHVAGEKTISRYPANEPYRCLSLNFLVSGVHRDMPRVSHWPERFGFDEFIAETLRFSHDETIDQCVWGEYLYQKIRWAAYLGSRQLKRAALPLTLNRALAELPGATDPHFSVAELARRTGVSEAHLYALFRKHLNTSPHRYLLDYRLRLARTQLAGGSNSIKEIAEAAGFENIESFYRAFHRVTGMPPGKYREEQQNHFQEN